MKIPFVIVGSGGHALSVANVVRSCDYRLVAFVDDEKAGQTLSGVPIITNRHCKESFKHASYAIGIADNSIRERVSKEYMADLPSAEFPTLVHKSSVIGFDVKIGRGTIVMPLAHIGPNSSVDEFCILNTCSSIDHHCCMRSYSSLAPRAVCGGTVEIGTRSAVSIGAIINHDLQIGSDSIIGANSYVNTLIADNVVAYGTPCKMIRSRTKDDRYL